MILDWQECVSDMARMKNANDFLMKAKLADKQQNSRFKSDSTVNRLINVCLQVLCQTSGMIKNGEIKTTSVIQSLEYHSESTETVISCV